MLKTSKSQKPEVLVTGTTGFFGRIIREQLEAEGYRIFGTTNRGKDTNDQVQIDIRKAEEIAQKLPDRDFPIIIHTVGIIDSDMPKQLMFDVNVKGTANLLEWAKKHHCQHFIQLSSVSVYGYKLLGENRPDSTHRCKYLGINYSKSKAAAERVIEQSGVPYTNLRIPPVLGPNDTYITPTIVPRLIEGNLLFGSKKDRSYSMFYVKNIGSILLKVIEHGSLNDSLNCTDYTVPWREYCQEYANLLGLPMPLQTVSLITGLTRWSDKHYLLMVGYSGMGASYKDQKLKQAVGWIPQYSWQQGVKEATESFMQANPEWAQKYQAIKQTKKGTQL